MKKATIILSFIALSFFSGVMGAYILNHLQAYNSISEIGNSCKTSVYHSSFQSEPNTASDKVPIDFVEASAKSTSSVVYIKTTTANQMAQNWFDQFFYGGGMTQQMVSSGSGVIFSTNGYIVTNLHVIDKADKIEVVLDKKTYNANLIGTDPNTDLAVLKINAENLIPIQFGNSKSLKVGEWVLAVGNPFNLNSTVTAGIVSAKGRNINVLKSKFPIESFIQTDAAINPGNSGGALVNIKGDLIGINTAILSQTGSYAGYGFAVPVDIVKKVTMDLVEYSEVQKSFTGVDITEIDDQNAVKYGLKSLNGVLISSVLKESPADKMGLKPNDVILEIENEKINSISAFEEILSYQRPGSSIHLKYERNGNLIETELKLTNKEGNFDLLKREIIVSDELAADLENVSKIEKQKLNTEGGVRILKIRSNSIFSRMGIGEGFVIISINKNPINSVSDLTNTLKTIKGRVILEGIDINSRRGYFSYYF